MTINENCLIQFEKVLYSQEYVAVWTETVMTVNENLIWENTK